MNRKEKGRKERKKVKFKGEQVVINFKSTRFSKLFVFKLNPCL